MTEPNPYGRRFWTYEDVANWIKANVPDPNASAMWWYVYRYTEQLVDDTIRHIAQSLAEGVGPFHEVDVTDFLQEYADKSGNSGGEGTSEEIDAEIEADLHKFFMEGR